MNGLIRVELLFKDSLPGCLHSMQNSAYMCYQDTVYKFLLLYNVKSQFIVAWLNGESLHIKIEKINLNFRHFHCLDTFTIFSHSD